MKKINKYILGTLFFLCWVSLILVVAAMEDGTISLSAGSILGIVIVISSALSGVAAGFLNIERKDNHEKYRHFKKS